MARGPVAEVVSQVFVPGKGERPHKMVRPGQTYLPRRQYVASRALTVVGIEEYAKSRGRFRKSEAYAICRSFPAAAPVDQPAKVRMTRVNVKRLASAEYELVPERAAANDGMTARPTGGFPVKVGEDRGDAVAAGCGVTETDMTHGPQGPEVAAEPSWREASVGQVSER